MINVKSTRNRISGTGVEKKIMEFLEAVFAHSHQCFKNFCIVVLAQH